MGSAMGWGTLKWWDVWVTTKPALPLGTPGGFWGCQDGAVLLLNLGQPPSLLGQFETVTGLPDKEPLVMKCLLSSSIPD